MTNESLKLEYFLRVNRILQIFCEQKSTFYLEYILSYVFSAIFLIFINQMFCLLENIYYRKPLKIPTFCLSTSVVPNRSAAAHKGAVKRCQGCRQILNLLPFKVFLLLRVPQIVIVAR
jgi:hypothetical protein